MASTVGPATVAPRKSAGPERNVAALPLSATSPRRKTAIPRCHGDGARLAGDAGLVRSARTSVVSDRNTVRRPRLTGSSELGTVRRRRLTGSSELGTVRRRRLTGSSRLGALRCRLTLVTSNLSSVRRTVPSRTHDVMMIRGDTSVSRVRTSVSRVRTTTNDPRTAGGSSLSSSQALRHRGIRDRVAIIRRCQRGRRERAAGSDSFVVVESALRLGLPRLREWSRRLQAGSDHLGGRNLDLPVADVEIISATQAFIKIPRR
jgi:hypothetical protein